jgi:hypothetical protein
MVPGRWRIGGEAGHEPHDAVKAVYEILQAEEPQELEDEFMAAAS